MRRAGTAPHLASLAMGALESPEGSGSHQIRHRHDPLRQASAPPLLARFDKHFDEKSEPNKRRTPALREEDYDRCLDASVDEAPGFFTTFGSDDLQAHAAPIVPIRKGNPRSPCNGISRPGDGYR